MDIRVARYFDDQFESRTFSLAIYGDSLDARTEYSINEVQRIATKSYPFKYDGDELKIQIGSDCIECHDLYDYLKSIALETSVLLDATSLDVPELALILSAFKDAEISAVDIFYVEPESYSEDTSYYSQTSNYNLSDNILGFENTGVPGVSMPVDDYATSSFVIFGGFEPSRLLGAFEAYEMNRDNSFIVIGVPGFKFGWDSISFRSNLKVLSDNQMSDAIKFSSANCPVSTYRLLNEVRACVGANNIFLLPLGTKPSSLGALLYMIQNRANTFLLFDRPVRKVGRTSGVGKKYMYRFISNAVSSNSI